MNTISRKEKKKTVYFQLTIYLLLNIIYITIINPNFNYGIFTFDNAFSFNRLAIATLLFIVLILICLRIKDNFFWCIWNIFFSYLFLPSSVYYIYNDGGVSLLGVSILLFFLTLGSKIKIKVSNKYIKEIKRNEILILVLFSVFMLVPFIITFYNSININNLLLIDVYDTRNVFKSLRNPIISYLQSPLVRVVLPVLFVKAINKRKWGLVVYSVAALIYVFLCGAFKSNLMVLILIFIFYFRAGYISKMFIFFKGITIIIFMSLIEKITFGSVLIADLFVRRVFFVPPMLDKVYCNYFNDNFIYGSYSKLMKLFFNNNQFGSSISIFVGENIIGRDNLNANVGFLTEGYINFGILGFVFSSLVITTIFIYLNSYKMDSKYFGIIIFYIYLMNTSFLETGLLTHGLLFFILCVPIFMRNEVVL